MTDYQLFGGVLRSELDLPELTPASHGTPSWVVTRHRAAIDTPVSSPIGREEVQPGVSVSLYHEPSSARLVFDDTGVFDISADGRFIRWYEPPDADLNAVRRDLLGRVFAVCLQQQRVFVLHGSAVQLGGVAIAFLAPKYHGKSTTAAALIEQGARLLGDDLVAVTPGKDPRVLPSVPVVQLWEDAARRVMKSARQWERGGASKVQVGQRTNGVPTRLAAMYLLAPVRPEAARTVRRTRLGSVESALTLLGQAKVGTLIGAERRLALLARLGELADRVPVYRLEIPRDFDRLPELTGALWNWHSPALIGAAVA